jgi:CzcA family heavy metal efflux pump
VISSTDASLHRAVGFVAVYHRRSRADAELIGAGFVARTPAPGDAGSPGGISKMRWIVESSLKFRLLVVAVAAALMGFGIMQLRHMPVDVYPEFTPPHVQVQTEALGLSAGEVEQLITVPLEADLLNGVAFLDEIRSESIPGLSSIELIFEPGTDVLKARQVVAERLTQAHALPQVSTPPVMIEPLASASRVMMVGLSSPNLSLIEQSVLARWKIKPRLMGVPGVANVSIWGQRERQLQVQVDPKQLQANGVSLVQVMETTGNALWVSPLSFVEASTPGTGGFIDTPNQRLGVQHVSPIVSAKDLAQVTVEDTGGRVLRLGDIAEVVEDHQPLIGDAVGKSGPGLMLVIEKFPGASTQQVTEDLKAALAALGPGLPGLTMDPTVYQPASYIDAGIGNVGRALLIGLVLLLVLLIGFFLDWRAALIAFVAVPLSLAAAGLVLYLRGASVNTMVVAGFVVAVAVLVADAVLDVDTVRRRLREHRRQAEQEEPADVVSRSTAGVVLDGVLEMRSSALFAMLIVLVAAVPVALLSGLTGFFSRPLVLSYALAVLASMVVALTVTPALAMLLLSSEPLNRRESPVLRWLQPRYDRALPSTLGSTRWVYPALAALVLGGIATIPLLRTPELLPSLQERQLLIQWDGAPGTSHPEMSRIVAAASNELRAIPGVQDVGAHVGRAITSDQVVGVNSSELWVTIRPGADYAKTVGAIRDIIRGYPGLAGDVELYPEQRIREVRTGVDQDLVVRVYGHELSTLRAQADKVHQAIRGIDGVVDTQVDQDVVEPTIEVKVNLAAAQRHGVKPGDVRRAAATLLSGVGVGSLFEEQKVFDVVVWGVPEIRQSVTGIRELLVDTPSGGHVRLGDVADVRVVPASNVIRRDSVARVVDVAFNVRGRDADGVMADVDAAIKGIDFPLEYHAELLGALTEQRGAAQRTTGFAVAAAITILLLLQAAVRSWRVAALLFLTLPATLAGSALAALLMARTPTLASLFGFIAVLGIAVRNGIVLVRRYRALELGTAGADRTDVVLQGSRENFGPIVLTAFGTALFLLPVLLLGTAPGLEVIRPVVIVVLGGLVTSTIFALFVLPVLYLQFASTPEPDIADPYAAPIPHQPEREAQLVTLRGNLDAAQ